MPLRGTTPTMLADFSGEVALRLRPRQQNCHPLMTLITLKTIRPLHSLSPKNSSPKLGEVSLATEGCVRFRFGFRFRFTIVFNFLYGSSQLPSLWAGPGVGSIAPNSSNPLTSAHNPSHSTKRSSALHPALLPPGQESR